MSKREPPWPSTPMPATEVRAMLALIPADERCSDGCPGWVVSDSDEHGLHIERCDDCCGRFDVHDPVFKQGIYDEDVAQLPEAQEELARVIAARGGQVVIAVPAPAAGRWEVEYLRTHADVDRFLKEDHADARITVFIHGRSAAEVATDAFTLSDDTGDAICIAGAERERAIADVTEAIKDVATGRGMAPRSGWFGVRFARPDGTEHVCCAECGSLRVQYAVWWDPVDREAVEVFGSWNNGDNTFCADCDLEGRDANPPLVDASAEPRAYRIARAKRGKLDEEGAES